MLSICDERIEESDESLFLECKCREYYYNYMKKIVLYRENKKQIQVDVSELNVSAEDIFDIEHKNCYSYTTK